jgi:hypothetical protein
MNKRCQAFSRVIGMSQNSPFSGVPGEGHSRKAEENRGKPHVIKALIENKPLMRYPIT